MPLTFDTNKYCENIFTQLIHTHWCCYLVTASASNSVMIAVFVHLTNAFIINIINIIIIRPQQLK